MQEPIASRLRSSRVRVHNVVVKAVLSRPVIGDAILSAYPSECRKGTKNWRSVIFKKRGDLGTVSIFDSGIMLVTGCDSVEKSQKTVDYYVKKIKRVGFPGLRLASFRVVNISTTFAWDGAFDADKYKREVDPTFRYSPTGFPCGRTVGTRTGALITLSRRKGQTVGGNVNLAHLRLDVYDVLRKMKSCLVPLGTEAEEGVNERFRAHFLRRAST